MCGADINGGYGHIAIAAGEGNTSKFRSYDQNWNGKAMKEVEHTYKNVYGVLRPKDQSKVASTLAGTGSFPKPVIWKNGSTKEIVYNENALKDEIGSLSPNESAQCYSKAGSSYLVVYKLDGINNHKAGFVEYAGGVSKAPPESKTYKNGSTAEIVYEDTGKRNKAGSLDVNETCYCLGKIDNMYLVLYKVNGSDTQKCGFVTYDGGC